MSSQISSYRFRCSNYGSWKFTTAVTTALSHVTWMQFSSLQLNVIPPSVPCTFLRVTIILKWMKLFQSHLLFKWMYAPENYRQVARFKVFTAMEIQLVIFWFVTPCSVAVRIPTFRMSMLPPYSEWRRWRQHGPLKRWYPVSQARRPRPEHTLASCKCP
jgi:hypothetical protein